MKILKILNALWNKLMFDPIEGSDLLALVYEGYKLGRNGWDMIEWADDVMIFKNKETGEVHEFHEG